MRKFWPVFLLLAPIIAYAMGDETFDGDVYFNKQVHVDGAVKTIQNNGYILNVSSANGTGAYFRIDSGGNITSATFNPAPAIGGFTSGSVIFAGATGTLTQKNAQFFWDNTNNRLGIGLTNPTSFLHISPSLSATDMFLVGTSSFVVKASGNVGIGVAAPVSTLDLQGSASFGAATTQSTFTTTAALNKAPSKAITLTGANGNVVSASSVTTTGGVFGFSGIFNGGRVGIGTTSPGALLHVNAATGAIFPQFQTGDTSRIYQQIVNTNAILDVGVEGTAGQSFTSSIAGAGVVIVEGAKPLQLGANSIVHATIESGGNVGIGVTAPVSTLDVQGSASFGAATTQSTFTTTGALNMAPSKAITLSGANGNVVAASSITTTGAIVGAFGQFGSPSTPLSALGTFNLVAPNFYQIATAPTINQDDNSQAANARVWQSGALASLTWRLRTINDAGTLAATGMEIARNAGTYTINYVSFPNGNVGIGTTNPAATLDVTGTASGSGVGINSMTSAQVRASTPLREGVLIYNSTLSAVCVSTGTTLMGYEIVGNTLLTTCQ